VKFIHSKRVYLFADQSIAQPEFAEVERFNMGLFEAIEGGCQDIDIRKFSEFPTNLDVSMETWAASRGLSDTFGQASMTFFTTAVVGRDPAEIGMHYFLDYIKSGRGFISIATEGEDGAQSLKIKQGKQFQGLKFERPDPPTSVFVY
jgi:monoamine oxidase